MKREIVEMTKISIFDDRAFGECNTAKALFHQFYWTGGRYRIMFSPGQSKMPGVPQEIREWIFSNIKAQMWVTGNPDLCYIDFRKDRDAFAFKMKWC